MDVVGLGVAHLLRAPAKDQLNNHLIESRKDTCFVLLKCHTSIAYISHSQACSCCTIFSNSGITLALCVCDLDLNSVLRPYGGHTC